MEKSTKFVIITGGLAIVTLLATLFATGIFSGNGTTKNIPSETGNTLTQSTPSSTGEVQQVTLKIVRGSYVTDPAVIKKGIPVRMTVDTSTVVGCSQDIVIPSFNVRKYVTATDNIIEFTPTKTGTINMMCSMNMYRGTFTVE